MKGLRKVRKELNWNNQSPLATRKALMKHLLRREKVKKLDHGENTQISFDFNKKASSVPSKKKAL